MAVPLERLQAIAWWNLQIVEASRGIEDGELAEDELAEGGASEASKPPHRPPLKEGLGVAATKRPDHTVNLPPPDVGTPRSGTGRRRSLADMAACVPPLTSATACLIPAGMPPGHRPGAGRGPADPGNRLVGKVLTGNGITRYANGAYSLVGATR